jgi:transposase
MLSLTDDIAARFEASADSSVGGCRAQHPVDSQGSWRPTADCQPLALWRHRYADHGLEGLKDKPRPGKQPIYTKATDKRILRLLDKPPPEGFARWTGPLLAEALGDVDVQYVWRFLRSHKIDFAARKSWCESNDPNFTAKAADVVGLYVAPPEKAIVLCVDEKPSIQALELWSERRAI